MKAERLQELINCDCIDIGKAFPELVPTVNRHPDTYFSTGPEPRKYRAVSESLYPEDPFDVKIANSMIKSLGKKIKHCMVTDGTIMTLYRYE